MESNPKSITEIRSLARSHTRTALNVLVGVMRNTRAPAEVRKQNSGADGRPFGQEPTF